MDLIKQKRVFDYVGYVCSKILLDDLNNCTFVLTVLKQFDKLVTSVLSVTNKDLQLQANETTFEQRKSHVQGCAMQVWKQTYLRNKRQKYVQDYECR